jgi:hypothetical protein
VEPSANEDAGDVAKLTFGNTETKFPSKREAAPEGQKNQRVHQNRIITSDRPPPSITKVVLSFWDMVQLKWPTMEIFKSLHLAETSTDFLASLHCESGQLA